MWQGHAIMIFLIEVQKMFTLLKKSDAALKKS